MSSFFHLIAFGTPETAPPPSPVSASAGDDVVFRPAALNGARSVVFRQLAVANETPVPAPNHASVPTPTSESLTESQHQMIVSSRPRVGRPNYKLHPTFVRPGSFLLRGHLAN